ncbi:restriction endonuclease subunit S [Weissella ceti]|uniref:Restriction endonuclease subunit S n=1 Tax=Weissella ceti TaxID=759620 RepID=A0ABT3E3L9_9LACO|nr:restriction endonuclease subunit S [Weissella ceti]MCW0952977.1 restriction endonuclease subunit S [Weissella ceti]QVK11521.1 restriction endonuclease subunit S [Weissella ceti]
MSNVRDNNNQYPAIRFAGFTDPWVQYKLGSLGVTKSGTGFSESEQGGISGTPFYKVSDMNILGNNVYMTNANNYVTDEQISNKKWNPIVPKNQGVLFAKVGAAIFLNRKRLVNEPFLIDNNMMAYLFDDSWNSYFGKIVFEKQNLHQFAQVGALPSYNASDIETIKVSVPLIEEQQLVGNLIKYVDQLIAANQ